MDCVIPFINTGSEKVSNDEVFFPFIWEQKRMILTGKFAGGHHILSYGLVENHGDYDLKALRLLNPGKVAFIRDISADVWTPGEGPDLHWKIRILRKLSDKITTLSVWHPYPQGYLYLKGDCGPNNYIGTVRKHKIVAKCPPYPLVKEDLEFRKILRNPSLSFVSNKAVQTQKKNVLIKLYQLVETEAILELDLEPGEARFFGCEFFVPKSAVKQTRHMAQWNSYGPSHFLSSLGGEINKLSTFRKEFDAKSDSVDRFRQFFSRVKNGFCDIGEFWATLAFEEEYESYENIAPLDVYHSEWGGVGKGASHYHSKTWIFDNLNFYIVSVITPRK